MTSTADQQKTTTSARKRLAVALRTAREGRHISRHKLAQQLHVPEDTILTIEDPDHDDISTAHLTALGRRYGELVGMQVPNLDLLLQALDEPEDLPLTQQRTVDVGTTFVLSRAGVALGIGAILLAVVGYALWQARALTSAPPLRLTAPTGNIVSQSPAVEIAGTSAPDSTVLVNGDPVPLAADGGFITIVYLQPGYNSLEVTAINSFSRRARVQRVLYFQPPPSTPTTVD